MKLHEYQAKELFASAGIPVPRGLPVTAASQASAAYETLKSRCGHAGDFVCSVKAQLHAGGRGKAGGILVARSASEAVAHAEALIGRRLVTAQTGPEGLPVSCVLLEERLAVREELYLALTVDRFQAKPVFLASRSGGMEIEALAAKDPQALVREPVEIGAPVPKASLARLSAALGCGGDQAASCAAIIRAVWQLFESHDASLIEINPLVFTADGRLTALDAKVTLDDNALFRQTGLAVLRDETQEHPLELEAGRIGISYVGLSGTIGCLVNGAGLAMATNDIITLCGGEPANFLDVGGGASVEQVTNAFSIILADARVKAVLVNIFGGIMRCDWIAQGLLNATRQLEVKVPIVVRLQGTNVEEGRRLLAGAKRLNLISVEELSEAAKKVVELANTK
jgi:succinyl-CoA synthetase beta subunit